MPGCARPRGRRSRGGDRPWSDARGRRRPRRALLDAVVWCLRGVCAGPPAALRDGWPAMATGGLMDGTPRLSRDGEPVYHSFLSTFADACVVPERSCIPIADDVPFERRASARGLRRVDRRRRGVAHGGGMRRRSRGSLQTMRWRAMAMVSVAHHYVLLRRPPRDLLRIPPPCATPRRRRSTRRSPQSTATSNGTSSAIGDARALGDDAGVGERGEEGVVVDRFALCARGRGVPSMEAAGCPSPAGAGARTSCGEVPRNTPRTAPHHGVQESATWSPTGPRASLQGPISSTTPAPSWPSTAGHTVSDRPSTAL